MKQFERLAGTPFSPEEISDVLHEFEEDGTLIKGFLVDDQHDISWGRKGYWSLRGSGPGLVAPFRPTDSGSLLRERFGFGSAYLVFHKEEPIAAFKANTRNATIEVTDFVGDSELEKEALRVMKEFAWEHQMPLTGELYEKLRSR